MAQSRSTCFSSTLSFTLYLILLLLYIIVCGLPFVFLSLVRALFGRSMKNLKGKIVMVTGSARGLGKALSEEFAKQGCKVICADISKDLNEKTVKEINGKFGDSATAMTCDVSDFESVQKLSFEIERRFEKVDILVNNAGILYSSLNPGNNEQAMTRKVVDVNLLSSFWLVQTFLPKMKENNEGHLVFINSISSLIPLGAAGVYTATKYGLLGFTESLLDEFSRTPACSNIKVSSVHPFFVRTEGLNDLNVTIRHIIVEPETAARLIVRGIRREYKKFAVPGDYLVFWVLSLSRIVPFRMYQALINGLYNKVLV